MAPLHMSEGRKIKQNCVLTARLDGVPTSKFTRMMSQSSSALVHGGMQGPGSGEP